MNASDDGPIMPCLTGGRLQCPSWEAEKFQAALRSTQAEAKRLEDIVLDQMDTIRKLEQRCEKLGATNTKLNKEIGQLQRKQAEAAATGENWQTIHMHYAGAIRVRIERRPNGPGA